MSDEEARRLDELESRVAIGELVVRYASTIDAHDLDGLMDVFTDDARFNELEGNAAIRQMFEAFMGATARSVHTPHTPVIRFQGPNRATGTVTGHAEQTGDGETLVMVLRYHDVYRRDGATWRIAERRTTYFYRLRAEEYAERFGSERPVYRGGEYTAADA